MPLVDRSSHSVVLRIVYDGPPDAGKATSVRYLRDHLPRGSREGELRSDDDRGSLFDWLEVGCGWPGGDRVRCQLAVVPRQLPLARRRHHLLDSADAVVFVADSRAAAAPETGAALRSLVRGLGRRDVPLLLQANKQDLPDAQPPDGLHGALGLAARVPVIGARAIDGAGIVETFLRAVRLAAEHARAVLVAAEPGEGDPAAGALLRRTLETDATEGLATLDALSRLADPAAGPLMLDAADADLPATSVSDILTRTRRESVTRPLRVVRPPPGAVRPVPAAAAPGAELAAAETVTLEAFTVERTVVDRRQVPAGAFEPTPIELVTVEAFTVERTVVGLNSGAPATLAAGAAPAAIAYATPAPSPAAATDPPAPGPTAARPSPAFFGTDDDPTWELPPVEPGAAVAAGSRRDPTGPRTAVRRERNTPAEPFPRTASGVYSIRRKAITPVKPLAPVAPVAAGTHHDPSPDETAIHRVPGESVGVDTYREPVAARRARTTPTEPLPPLAPVAAGTRLEPLVPTAAERESQPRIELGEAGVRELRPAPGTAPPLALESLPFQLPPVDLPAGMVWPGVAGRAVLAALGAPVRLVPQPASWAPTAAVELVYSDGWSAHTSAELVFPAVERGRPVLFDAIRWQAKLSHLTPPGRTYALAPERDRVRLWVLTPPYRTVWAAIEEAFAHGDRATAGRLARTGLEAVDELRARGVPIADLDHIAVDDPSRLLATPWTPHRDRLIAQLQRLFAAAVL